jgi:small-conductance mechanosensitive channel
MRLRSIGPVPSFAAGAAIALTLAGASVSAQSGTTMAQLQAQVQAQQAEIDELKARTARKLDTPAARPALQPLRLRRMATVVPGQSLGQALEAFHAQHVKFVQPASPAFGARFAPLIAATPHALPPAASGLAGQQAEIDFLYQGLIEAASELNQVKSQLQATNATVSGVASTATNTKAELGLDEIALYGMLGTVQTNMSQQQTQMASDEQNLAGVDSTLQFAVPDLYAAGDALCINGMLGPQAFLPVDGAPLNCSS